MSRSILITAIVIVLSVICVTNERSNHLSAPVEIHSGYIDLNLWDREQFPTINLTGQWKFFPDQLVNPQQLSLLSAHANSIGVPGSWHKKITAQPFPFQGHGVGTYWLSMTGLTPNESINLNIDRSCSNARIYFFPANNPINRPLFKLGQTSKNAKLSKAYAGSTQINLPFTGNVEHHLLIQVSNFNFHTGGLCGNLQMGAVSGLSHYRSVQIAKQTMLITIIIMAALYPLALYIQHRQDPTPLWLSLFCMSSATFFLAISGFIEQLIPSESDWIFEIRTRLTFIALSWTSTALLMFYHYNVPNSVNKLWLDLNLKIVLFCTLIILLTPAWIINAFVFVLITYWVIQFLASLRILVNAVLDKQPYTKSMLIAFIPLLATLPFEIINRVNLNSLSVSGIYCLIFFIFVENQIIAQRFADTLKLAARLSKNLQEEVSLQTAALSKKNKQLEDAQSALRLTNQSLKQLSITDGLTQLYNRAHFDQELANEWRRGTRQNTDLSILMIDVDHFKKLNDTAGHLAGDHALILISTELRQHFKRAGELVARYGGEEFAVILPNTNQPMALYVAESLRQVIEKLDITYNNSSYSVTISIGICSTIPSANYRVCDLLQGADSALYDAKNKGRNLVSMMPLFPILERSKQHH